MHIFPFWNFCNQDTYLCHPLTLKKVVFLCKIFHLHKGFVLSNDKKKQKPICYDFRYGVSYLVVPKLRYGKVVIEFDLYLVIVEGLDLIHCT